MYVQVREMRYRQLVEESVVVIQSYYRGWRVRTYFRIEQAALVIQKYFRCICIYTLLTILLSTVTSFTEDSSCVRSNTCVYVRTLSKCRWLVLIMLAPCRGWRVRMETRVMFTEWAGPKVADFMWRALVR